MDQKMEVWTMLDIGIRDAMATEGFAMLCLAMLSLGRLVWWWLPWVVDHYSTMRHGGISGQKGIRESFPVWLASIQRPLKYCRLVKHD